jgi:glycerol-3-phosphate dehydrogenase
MWPLRFVMPHDPSMRPAWMMRAACSCTTTWPARAAAGQHGTVDLRGMTRPARR